MEVLAVLAGGPQEPRRYSSLAQARDDYLWYRRGAERDVERDGEIVGILTRYDVVQHLTGMSR
jgi:CBS domain-containing protein